MSVVEKIKRDLIRIVFYFDSNINGFGFFLMFYLLFFFAAIMALSNIIIIMFKTLSTAIIYIRLFIWLNIAIKI